MHPNSYPQASSALPRTGVPVGAVTSMGLLGAMVGAVAAAAKDMREVRAGTKTKAQAASDVAREAVGTGLAAAAGVAAAGTVARSQSLALATLALVGVGAKYLYDGLLDAACEVKPAARTSAVATSKKA